MKSTQEPSFYPSPHHTSDMSSLPEAEMVSCAGDGHLLREVKKSSIYTMQTSRKCVNFSINTQQPNFWVSSECQYKRLSAVCQPHQTPVIGTLPWP